MFYAILAKKVQNNWLEVIYIPQYISIKYIYYSITHEKVVFDPGFQLMSQRGV